MASWDETFKAWAKSLSEVDEAKGSRAAEEVRVAIRGDATLAKKRIDVFVTGSYRNTTNTRADSDVDVAIVLRDVFLYDLPSGRPPTKEMLGFFKDSDYRFDAFREDVGKALRARFGAAQVSAGNKAFDIRATSYSLDADVAPFFEYRLYTGEKDAQGGWAYLAGVAMRPRSDAGVRIINWPEQHYQNGCTKNEATGRRFKRVVRILKRLRAHMEGQGDAAAKSAAGQARSMLIECLVYNVPDTCFYQQEGGYLKDVGAVLDWLDRATRHGADASGLWEVNRRKPLFASSQRWTQAQAHAFVLGARRTVGL